MQVHNLVTAAILDALITIIGHTNAQTPDEERERRGPDGIYRNPICDYEFRIKNPLRIMLEEVPTGVTASSSEWDMEVFANNKSGTWTLVGKSKDPSARLKTTWCRLSSSIGTSYEREKWFQLYFRK